VLGYHVIDSAARERDFQSRVYLVILSSRGEPFRKAATVLISRTGGELACSNLLLFNHKVAPLTFIAEFRAPHPPVGEIEEHGQARSAGRLNAPDCRIRFRCHTARHCHCLGRNARLMGVPYLRIMGRHGHGAAMCSRSVLVHCLSRLGAAAAVLAAELLGGHRVLTKWAPERGKAIDRFDGVMSHSLNCRRLPRHDFELKSQPVIASTSTKLTWNSVDHPLRPGARAAQALES